MKVKIITQNSIAKAYGVCKSNISKYMKKTGFDKRTIYVRKRATGFRRTKALKEKDAIALWEKRKKDGYPKPNLVFDKFYEIIE